MTELRRLGNECRSSKPLVGLRWSLVTRGFDGGIQYHRVDRVAVSQRPIEGYAGAEGLDGLVARVGKSSGRLKADSRPAIAEREIGCMMKA